jgi:hypothetical protein
MFYPAAVNGEIWTRGLGVLRGVVQPVDDHLQPTCSIAMTELTQYPTALATARSRFQVRITGDAMPPNRYAWEIWELAREVCIRRSVERYRTLQAAWEAGTAALGRRGGQTL